MPMLWFRSDEKAWRSVPLDEHAYALSGQTASPVADGSWPVQDGGGALLCRAPGPASGAKKWRLVTLPHAHVQVNGAPVILGLRVLSDRDEIRCGASAPFFFSTESIARVAPFTGGSARPVDCPRCKKVLTPGSPSVACPGCSVVHHEACWSYSDRCASCPHPTALDAGPRWSPGEV